MRKVCALLILFLCLSSVLGKEARIRVAYFNHLFGHIHKNPSQYSVSLSTVSCGHPISILGEKGKEIVRSGFHKIKAGPYVGYISVDYLDKKKPICFQDKYPRFFDNLDLSLSDMYYWGKLYDQYVRGKSVIR